MNGRQHGRLRVFFAVEFFCSREGHLQSDLLSRNPHACVACFQHRTIQIGVDRSPVLCLRGLVFDGCNEGRAARSLYLVEVTFPGFCSIACIVLYFARSSFMRSSCEPKKYTQKTLWWQGLCKS